MPGTLARSQNVNYYGGSHLRSMFHLLTVTQVLMMAPLFLFVINDIIVIGKHYYQVITAYPQSDRSTSASINQLSRSNKKGEGDKENANDPNRKDIEWASFLVNLVLGAVMAYLIHARYKRINRRREMLEEELLSIHSCSIIWQAVAFAHRAALEKGAGHFDHYTERISIVAAKFAQDVGQIHNVLRSDRKTVMGWFH